MIHGREKTLDPAVGMKQRAAGEKSFCSQHTCDGLFKLVEIQLLKDTLPVLGGHVFHVQVELPEPKAGPLLPTPSRNTKLPDLSHSSDQNKSTGINGEGVTGLRREEFTAPWHAKGGLGTEERPGPEIVQHIGEVLRVTVDEELPVFVRLPCAAAQHCGEESVLLGKQRCLRGEELGAREWLSTYSLPIIGQPRF